MGGWAFFQDCLSGLYILFWPACSLEPPLAASRTGEASTSGCGLSCAADQMMPHFALHGLSELKIFAAYAVFFGSYLVFMLGKFPGMKIDRAGAGIIGAVLMVAFRIMTPVDALRYIDFSTIVLLFSMMLIVAYLHLAGIFEWITHLVVTRLRPHHLLPTVIFTSGVLSAFFVNDIICLVMVPFVLTATRRMGVKPLPYLLAVATASNIGSVATITGSVANIIVVGRSKDIAPISFREYFQVGLPITVATLMLGMVWLWLID
jgi:Na+/H+ antiporter NhaD/arsenite permease-like protein